METHWASRRICRWKRRTGFTRHAQILPATGRKEVWLVIRETWYLAEWRRYRGWWLLDKGHMHDGERVILFSFPRPKETAPVKKRTVPAAGVIRQPLSNESVFMNDQPRLRAWITETAFPDGTPRTPGDYKVKNRETTFECTLYDNDAGLRLPLRASTLDELWTLVEIAIDAEGLPWEVDDYLQSQIAKKKKKKAA